MQFAEVSQMISGELKSFDQGPFQEPSSEFHLQRSPFMILRHLPFEIPYLARGQSLVPASPGGKF